MHGPREWRHTLSAVVNGLVARGFAIDGLWGTTSVVPEPGSWEHPKSIAPPWLRLWTTRRG